VGKPEGEPTTALREHHDYAPSKGRRQSGAGEEPDVLLDALVKVGDLALEVEGLRARVSVQAEVAQLVKLSVAADVNLDRLNVMAQDVDVQALLKVRLDEVRTILDEALTAVGENPAILLGALSSVGTAAGEIGGAVRMRRAGEAG
jgi:hypothetical protein